jgi:trimethylamine--corrinoid protein Co-methyltransferase
VLPEEHLERIHSAVLDALEEIGVRIGSGAVLERLRAAGAPVDAEARRARFPRSLVEDVLRPAPRELLLGARDPACDLRVNDGQGWLSTGGPADTVVDFTTGARRASVLADVALGSRLADAVPQIGFVGPSAVALDVAAGSRSLHELATQASNTSKHVQVEVTNDVAGAEALVEVARAVAGGEAPLRERPVVSAYLTIRSPLVLNGERLEAAALLARAGVPCGFVAMPVVGISAPATLAGALATAAAEVLAGVVALQLLEPGATTFFGTRALEVDLGDGRSAPGGPKDPLFQMAWVQLGRDFALPVHLGAFATGARSSDWQAGMEGGLSGTACWMMGPDLLAGAGLRDGTRAFSPVALLLDTELFDLVRQIPLGFEVDEETLAVEVIEKVGPGEHFLGEAHTLRHMREAWKARLMDTDTWEAWEEKGRPEPPERAAERVRELLASHEPTRLEPAAEERIREVIAEHERERGL